MRHNASSLHSCTPDPKHLPHARLGRADLGSFPCRHPAPHKLALAPCTGGLLLRESALPTILERDGTKRSCKGVSFTQTESDQAAYGSRKAKVYGASLQMEAWDANARILAPLFCKLSPPLSKEWRAAGEFGDPSWLRTYLDERATSDQKLSEDEGWARRKLEAAAGSEVAARAVGHRN